MDLLCLLLIAVGLSMDAFAVSVAGGIVTKRAHVLHAVRLGTFFGLFQAVMPAVGWLAGSRVSGFITHVDHWVAFGVLSFIGGKMIVESFKLERAERASREMGTLVLLALSVATSIDALAVGFSFAVLDVAIVTPALVIGAVTFVICVFGGLIGSRLGHFFEKNIEILGGLVLIAIGVRILLGGLL